MLQPMSFMILSKQFVYIQLKKTGSELIGSKVVDLYGDYFCSNSKLEYFIQHTLSKYFNTDDEHNRFVIFHPIYIRAFNVVNNVGFDGEGITVTYI